MANPWEPQFKDAPETVLYGNNNGKAKPSSWKRTGFADWIDYDQANNVIKYGTYTFNPAEVFGLKITDRGSWEEKVKREQEALKQKYGAFYPVVAGLMGTQSNTSSILGDYQKQQWEKNRKQFTWTDPKTGKVYQETGSGDTLLPMSQAFAQMVSDATWANRTNTQTSRWGQNPGGQGKDPNSMKPTNTSGGKNPLKGLLA